MYTFANQSGPIPLNELDFNFTTLSTQVSPLVSVGTVGQVLTSNGTSAYWAASGAGVTQIIAGSNVTISPVGGTGAVTINATGGGGGSPGGSDTQVQYNSSGSFAGSANLTFDGTNLSLGASSQVRGSSTNAPPILADSAGNTATLMAWVNFVGNGGAGACVINASFNVSGVTKITTGEYAITFATAMPDDKYAVVGAATPPAANAMCVFGYGASGNGVVIPPTTTQVVVFTLYDVHYGDYANSVSVSVGIYR